MNTKYMIVGTYKIFGYKFVEAIVSSKAIAEAYLKKLAADRDITFSIEVV